MLIEMGMLGALPHFVNSATSSSYLEDLVLSFKQDATSVAYNVTMVEQCESGGSGPLYSIAGVTEAGNWYHFGIDWNWHSSAGFRAFFNVESPSSNLFTAKDPMSQIHDGDSVLLSMSFSGGKVIMSVHDWNTSASDEQSYSVLGATRFVGNPSSPADSNGMFTGILTRENHQAPYYGDMQSVVYRTSTPISGAYMRIVEFPYPSKSPVVFDDYGSYDYANPSLLQDFHSNGATLASDAYEFQTGGLSTAPKCASPAGSSQLPFLGGITRLLEILGAIGAVGVVLTLLGVLITRRREKKPPQTSTTSL
jgi:hypothetical protein